jgi:hypothetical protein
MGGMGLEALVDVWQATSIQNDTDLKELLDFFSLSSSTLMVNRAFS